MSRKAWIASLKPGSAVAFGLKEHRRAAVVRELHLDSPRPVLIVSFANLERMQIDAGSIFLAPLAPAELEQYRQARRLRPLAPFCVALGLALADRETFAEWKATE